MGFGKLFGHKRSGPKSPDPSRKPEKEETENDGKKDSPTAEGKPPSTHYDANIVYPFYDVKATSFPPPRTIDASVFTEPQRSGSIVDGDRMTSRKPTSTENVGSEEKVIEDTEVAETKAEDDKEKDVARECNIKNCTKENCSLENCENRAARKQSFEGTISPKKLTEIINNSIKEAVQTIVKQCAMEDKKTSSHEETEKKPKEDVRSTICYTTDVAPIKIKREHRSRITREQYDDHSKLSKPHDNPRKPNFPSPQEKHDNVIRMNSKKFADEGARTKCHRRTRENLCKNARAKKPSVSPNNVKTDNRRMTGNVNIYICSEATETTQANGQQTPKPQICTKRSSETETEDSNEICGRSSSTSSCKLVSNILKKRQKLQLQSSLDLLAEKGEVESNGSEDNACSCTVGSTERNSVSKSGSNDPIKKTSSEDVDIERVESLSSIENGGCCGSSSFRSTDTKIDDSDGSFQRSRLIVCDNAKPSGPWTAESIYPAELMSDSFGSEDRLSKSVCSNVDRADRYQDTDYVLKNRRPRSIWESETENISCDKHDDNNWPAKSTRTDHYRLGNHRRINCNARGHRKGVCRTMTDNDWAKADSRSNRAHPYKSNFKLVCDPSDRRTIARKNYGEKIPGDSISDIEWSPNSDCAIAEKTICKCHEGDRDSVVICSKWEVGCNYKPSKKRFVKINRKEKLTQQRSICNCIAEEDEENDVRGKHLPEFSISEKSIEDIQGTACKKSSASEEQIICPLSGNSERQGSRGKGTTRTTYEDSKIVPDKSADGNGRKVFEDSNQDDAPRDKNGTEGNPKEKERGQSGAKGKEDSGKTFKLLNIEHRLLKNIRKPRTKPEATSKGIDEKPITSVLPKSDTVEPGTENILRDIKLKSPSLRRPADTQRNKLQQQSTIAEDNKSKDSDKLKEGKSMEKGSKEKEEKTYQEKVKDSVLFRTLKKILDSIKQRTTVQPTKSKDEPDASKSISPDSDAVRKLNDSKSEPKADQLSARTKIPIKQKSSDEDKSTVVLSTSALHKEKDSKSAGHTIKGSSTKVSKNIDDKRIFTSDVRPISHGTTSSENTAKDPEENVVGNTAPEKSPKSKLLTALTSKRPLTSSEKNSEKKTEHKSTKGTKQGEISQKVEVQKISETPISQAKKKEPRIQGTGKESAHEETAKSVEPQQPIVRDIITSDDKRTPKKVDITKTPSSDVQSDAIMAYSSYGQAEKERVPKSAASQWEDATSFLASKCAISQYTAYGENDEGFRDKDDIKPKDGCPCCHPPITTCYSEGIKPSKICVGKDRDVPNTAAASCGPPVYPTRCRNWKSCKCRKQVTCTDCYKSETEYRRNCPRKNMFLCRRTPFCLYCDNPRDRCICRAPLRTCSYCGLSADLCRCEDQEIFDCNGRPVLTEPDNDRTIRVTAWTPRREVRRYFGRNLEDLRTETDEECRCHEKLKPHGSDDLPYQRLSVFSDVMNELQQKISESVCCARCRRVPCCCNTRTEECGEARCFVSSPRPRCRTVTRDLEKPRSKSPSNSKRDTCPVTNDLPRTIPTRICCACNATPCRCRKNRSSQKRPRAKCYYCKSSPCVLVLNLLAGIHRHARRKLPALERY